MKSKNKTKNFNNVKEINQLKYQNFYYRTGLNQNHKKIYKIIIKIKNLQKLFNLHLVKKLLHQTII